MARSVANLAVSVTAKTSKFRKGMGRARKALKKFRVGIAKTLKRLTKFTALMAAAAAAGAAFLARSQMKTIDSMAKLADRIGTTTEKLAGLHHAAEITGAGAELMSKSLDVMTKRLGEAAGGTGEAKDTIKELGLNLQELIEMDPADAFYRIADAISRLPTQAQKAAAASDLFSRAGLQLVNTLDLGAKGLRKMHVEAVLLGLAFSRIDAAKVEAANDAIQRMRETFIGIGRTIAINIAPYIEFVAKQLQELGIGANRAIGKFFDYVTANAPKVATLMALWVLDLQLQFKRFVISAQLGLAVLIEGFANLIEASGRMSGKGSGAGDQFRLMAFGLRWTAAEAIKEADAFEEAMGRRGQAFGDWVGSIAKDSQKAAEALVHGMKAAKTPKGGLLGHLISQFGIDVPSFKDIGKSAAEAFIEGYAKVMETIGKVTAWFDKKSKATGGGAARFAMGGSEVDLRNISLGQGTRRQGQKVEDRQLRTTNAILAVIQENTSSGMGMR